MINIADEDFPDVIEQAGYEPTPYSGRGSTGLCVGLITDDSAMTVAANLVEAAESQEQAVDILRAMRDDYSMNLGRVYYWPRVEWIEKQRKPG